MSLTSINSRNSVQGNTMKPFKVRETFESRKEEVLNIRSRFPNKIPVVVERSNKEKILPILDKPKFLVPKELQLAKFSSVVRNQMKIGQTHTFYMIINKKTIVSIKKTMQEIYNENKDKDGFLYITYSSQEMFG